nr:FecR domain-containing protein [Sinomicrobium weinanense]
MSAGFYYYGGEQTSAIYKYAKTGTEDPDKNNSDVELIFSDGQGVVVSESDSAITYSKTGKEVRIGASRTITQDKEQQGVAYNTLIVPYGRRSRVALSDGTVVWLNSGSKLVYPVAFTQKNREVYLEGEGIFDVAHNKDQPFLVLADDHKIKVLGTVFNVSNYPEDSSVSTVLKSGSVEIAYKGDGLLKKEKTIRISPGTMTVYDKGSQQMASREVDVENYFSWKEGIFIFEGDRLDDIVKKLSRYYNVDIRIKNKTLAGQTFSGYLDLKNSVEQVISTIGKTTDFEYSRGGENQWIINQKN